MSENATVAAEETTAAAESTEDLSYQAVEKDGSVTAIWEMQGQKHIRTIDPRSAEGKQILAESGLNIIAATDMADAARKAVEAAGTAARA